MLNSWECPQQQTLHAQSGQELGAPAAAAPLTPLAYAKWHMGHYTGTCDVPQNTKERQFHHHLPTGSMRAQSCS
jgi:hypothetical protein